MKTCLRAVLTKNVSVLLFVLTCLLFGSVVVTAKIMADDVLSIEQKTLTPDGIEIDG